LLPIAKLVDPTMNQSDYATRAKTRAEYTTGKSGREIKAANTAIYHANDLADMIPQLGNNETLPWFNKGIQAVKGQFSPEFQDVKGRYDSKQGNRVKEIRRRRGLRDIRRPTLRFCAGGGLNPCPGPCG
jgi:hypothetical protein